MMSSNFIEVTVARGSGTVLERGRVLGVKMFLSSKSEEDGDSRHCVWKSSLPVGGGTRISWGRSRGLVPIINGVPGRVSGVRPMSSSSSVAGISGIDRLLLGASEFISTKLPDPLDAPANRSAAAVRERESERHRLQWPISRTLFGIATSATMMAGPFLPPQVVLDGFKERPEALEIQGSLSLQSTHGSF